MNILTLENVSKRFGNREIIKNLSFSVMEHTIYGFIGQNGAGKTTTMKMILGLSSPDQGTIRVNDQLVTYGSNSTNKFIGYLPDVPEFYNYMTPTEYLNLCGEITNLSSVKRKKEIHELLDLVGLQNADKKIQGFSRGMKQRLGIAQALLNHHSLLICDEPTSALDPLGRKEILDILLSVKERTTVVFSTHILSDVERICDNIGLLHNGSIALEGNMNEILLSHKTRGFQIEFQNPIDMEAFTNLYHPGTRLSTTLLEYEQGESSDIPSVMHILSENRITPKKLELKEPTLESLFMEVIHK